MKSVAYSRSKTLATANLRAEGDLLLIGPTASHAVGLVPIDSGADFVVLPARLAHLAGIPLPAKATTTLHGIGGGIPVHIQPNVALELEGSAIRADVMFDFSNGAPALFGRSGIRALAALGLDPTDWHWTP